MQRPLDLPEPAPPSHGAAPPPAVRGAESRIPTRSIVAYSLPVVGYGYLFMLTSLYLVKFATDVLLMPALAIGLIYTGSRVWDAVSDPLAGYLSDRTRARMGRRRPWMLASALPLALATFMIWSPPRALEGGALVAWMALAIFAFFTASTLFGVPHASLGAELSLAHHERTRIFAWRHAGFATGLFLMIPALYWLTTTEAKREAARLLALGGALLTAAGIVFMTARLRERPEFRDRGSRDPVRAYRDVLRNPHARLLLSVFLIENVGSASLGILGPYVTQYIVGDESKFPMLLLAYLVPALLLVPAGPPLSRRIGKKRLWLVSMLLSMVAFGSLFFVGPGSYGFLCGCGVLAGVSNAWGSTVGPSIQADVIDWDEWRTGERKEGAYFAAWNLVQKSAFALSILVTTTALHLIGYEPGVEQPPEVRFWLLALFSLLPAGGYGIGILLFRRFRLGEADHRRIRAELDRRALAGERPGDVA